MYSHRVNSPKNLAKYSGNTSSKIVSCIRARVRIQAPHVLAQKLIPQEFFPACIGFVPGGMLDFCWQMSFKFQREIGVKFVTKTSPDSAQQGDKWSPGIHFGGACS